MKFKEEIHTIPINDAIENAGECPFCYIEKRSEERMMDFVLGAGASYMESDIRGQTDKAGFCRVHYQKMFRYGNALGNAWILKTHFKETIDEFNKETAHFKPESAKKGGLFRKKGTETADTNALVSWAKAREKSCYICDTLEKTFQNYLETFFTMYQKDSEFREKILHGNGFCLTHFADLLAGADARLSDKELADFYDRILPLERENLSRVYEDVAWFIEKYDYKNKDADWKNSKDAVQRAMQKQKGGLPAEPFYEMKK